MDFVVLKPVKGFHSFNFIFNNGRKFYEKECLAVFSSKLWFEKSNNDDIILENTIFFGVSVPKKICKLAVNRNRIKRLLRESIRIYYKGKEKRNYSFNCFVITWKQAPINFKEISLRDVQPIVNQMLDKAENYFAKKHEGN